jgi:hypothetical protein
MNIVTLYTTDETMLAACGHILRAGDVLHVRDSYVYCSKECADIGDFSWCFSDPSDGDLFLKTGDRRFKPGTYEPLGAPA